MKTHSRPGRSAPDLPPPPAPTARDANPWPMPEQYGERPPKTPGVTPPLRPKTGVPVGPARRAPTQPTIDSKRTRRSPMRGLPIMILFAAMVGAIVAARRAIASGDVASAIGPIVIVAIIAYSWWHGRSRRG